MKKKFFIIAILLPQITWAWGMLGHRTIASVAEKLLAPSVKIELRKYFPAGENLADSAYWADSLKANPALWGHTTSYHFEQIPDGKTYFQSLKIQSAEERKKGGTVEALIEAQNVFLSATPAAEKTNALKFLIHFVGDIHQPLHSGRPEDNGGNKIPVNWHGTQTNLHSVWDTLLINEAYNEAMQIRESKSFTDETYAEFLIEKFSNSSSPQNKDDFEAWLKESMALRKDAYVYKDESEKQYTQRFTHVVDAQIYKAGVRLAAVLTRLTKGQTPTATQMNLQTAIEKITGPLKSFISLRPRAQLTSEEKTLAPDSSENAELCNPLLLL
ncbi:MAG: S1/P1 nuclease [Pseudobdellovibrionaceae bacterium]